MNCYSELISMKCPSWCGFCIVEQLKVNSSVVSKNTLNTLNATNIDHHPPENPKLNIKLRSVYQKYLSTNAV